MTTRSLTKFSPEKLVILSNQPSLMQDGMDCYPIQIIERHAECLEAYCYSLRKFHGNSERTEPRYMYKGLMIPLLLLKT